MAGRVPTSWCRQAACSIAAHSANRGLPANRGDQAVVPVAFRPDLTKPLEASGSIHSLFRQVDVPSAIQAHAVSAIQGSAATTRESALGIEHRKPRYLIAHEDHIFSVHNNCHGMENVPNVADEISIQIEELDSVVLSITDNQRAILGKCEIVWRAEFTRSRSGNTPAPDQFPGGRKTMDV